MWAVVSVIVFAGEYLYADILWEAPHLHGVEGELVPSWDGRIKVIVKEGVAVSVVCPGPGEKDTFLVRPGVDIVGPVAIFDLIGHPNPLGNETLGRQSEFKHLIGNVEIGSEHFLSQLNPSVRIEIESASIIWNFSGQVELHAKEIIERVNELVATHPTIGIGLIFNLALGQPIQHHTFLLCTRLLFVLRWHLCRNQIFEHQGSIKRFIAKQAGHVDISFLNVLVVAIEAVLLEKLDCLYLGQKR